MDEDYHLSTPALVSILFKEGLKIVPFISNAVGAYESIMGEMEKNRVRSLLEELSARLDNIVAVLSDSHSLQILLYGCDQARSDILFPSKRREYGGAVSHLIVNNAALDDVVAILDSLRKLNAGDLRILYAFRQGVDISVMREVLYLLPNDPVVRQHGTEESIAKRFSQMLPNLMRLQGLGLIYMTPTPPLTLPNIEIGPMTDQFRQHVHLTDIGQKLVKALPA